MNSGGVVERFGASPRERFGGVEGLSERNRLQP